MEKQKKPFVTAVLVIIVLALIGCSVYVVYASLAEYTRVSNEQAKDGEPWYGTEATVPRTTAGTTTQRTTLGSVYYNGNSAGDDYYHVQEYSDANEFADENEGEFDGGYEEAYEYYWEYYGNDYAYE